MNFFDAQNPPVDRDVRLDLVLKATRVGLWDWNVQTGNAVFSDRWAEIIGYTLDELEPSNIDTWTRFAHPDDVKRSEELLGRHFAGELPYYECECRMRHKDGHWIWVLDRGMVIAWTDAGKPLRMTGTHADITERKRAAKNERRARENFETLFNTIKDFLFVLDEQGCILHANATVVRRLGYTLDELAGVPVLMMHPAECRAEAEKIVLAMLAGEADFCPVPLISRSGELIPVETRVTPGRWDGKPVLFGVSIDIAKRKQAEEALSLRESYLSAIIENQSGLIWLKDAESRFLAVNKAFAISCGKQKASDLDGLTDLDIWPAEMAEKYREDDFSVMQLRKPVMVEEQVYDQGVAKWFETYKTPVFDGQGVVIGTTGYARDITKRKQMEEALSRQTTLLSNLLDSMPEIVFFKDLDGIYLGCNPLFEEFLGRPREKIIGHTDYDLLPKEVADAFRKNDRVMMAENKARHNEEWITYPDGRRLLMDTLKAPLFDSNGRIDGMLGVSRDITERKQAEEALVQQSRLQKILMDIATTYINLPLEEVGQAVQAALKDLGEFVEADRAYIFDYDFPGGICTNTFEWCRDGIIPQLEALQAVPLAELGDWVATHRRGDGVYYPDVAALPPGGVRDILEPQQIKSLLTIPLTHGEDCLGFVGFDSVRQHHVYSEKERILLSLFAQMLTNVRLRRRNEDELMETTLLANNLADKANTAAQEKEMFLANMSHEIRTPLNAVLGHAQIMSRECEGCPIKQHSLDAIVKSGEHLLELINDIMTVIQIDVKEVPLSPSDFDFYNLLDSVRIMSGQRLQGVVPIEIVMAPDLPQWLYADQGKIRQVLLNLSGNAAKFTQRGRVVLSAGISQIGAEDSLLLTVDVEDSGCGIDTDDFERVFNPFEQTGQKQKMRKGVGLGLPLARRYAQALGGDVVILRSSPGQGSTFRFMFKAGLSKLSTEEKTECAATVCRVAPDQQAPRILAVDDDATSLQMLASMLKGAGFIVERADSGARALQLCREGRRFDLILMDKQMPDMDGLETMSRLRKLPEGQSTPIVIVTAGGLRDTRKKLLEAGADGYVSKPVGRELLLAEIRKLIGVRYEYDQDVATQDQPVKNLSGLAQVPVEQKKALRQAILLGNVFEMREIVEKIATDHPGVAAGLTRLINDYDYDSLTRWLNPKTGETE